MYCKACGCQFASSEAAICIKCGVQKGVGSAYCQNCGNQTQTGAAVCLSCGAALTGAISGDSKSKLAAGLLGIFLGWIGVHNFYLGFTTKAIIQLVLGLLGFLTCGITTLASSIWGLIEGIFILSGKISADAKGNLLKD